jgi:hypothetical protein
MNLKGDRQVMGWCGCIVTPPADDVLTLFGCGDEVIG